MDGKEEIRLYREAMGDEATARNLLEGQNRYPCCWWERASGHHPDCKHNPKKRIAKQYRKEYGDGVSAMEGE